MAPGGLFLIFGLICGAAINYFADVMPFKRRLSQPWCQKCEKSRTWKRYFLLLPCEECNHNRTLRVFLVQLGFPIISIVTGIFPPLRFNSFLGVLLLAYFALVMVIDIEHRLVLNPTIIAGIIIGSLVGLSLHGLLSTILGGTAGFLFMFLLYYFGIAFSKWMSRLRHETIDEVALGYGDVNLSGVLGLLLGWPGITAGIFLAIMIGGAASLVILVIAKVRGTYKLFTPIPYAPFLIISALLLLFRP